MEIKADKVKKTIETDNQRPLPQPGEFYRHFKGRFYQIIALAKDAGTLEMQVVYQALYGSFGVWVRPLSEFMSPLDRDKYPEAGQTWRFEKALPEEMTAAAETNAAAPDIRSDASAENSFTLDPLVEKFLDADNIADKLQILDALRPRVTDAMIDTMAIASGVEVAEGDVQNRLWDLRECLRTIERYEQTRDRFR